MMGYSDAQWYIKDTWLDFSATNIGIQAVVCYTFMASLTMGCLKMVELLPIAHECFRKQNF